MLQSVLFTLLQLSRSDSDSCMHKSRESFIRGTYERRSLRYKQPVRSVKNRLPIARQAQPPKRTSLDLELDLKVSEAKLTHLLEEINRLKELKRKMEEAKKNGKKFLYRPTRRIDKNRWHLIVSLI